MARILAVWELGGGMGHVSALAPVLGSLAERGHHTGLAALNLDSAQKALRNSAIELMQAPVSLTSPKQQITPPSTYADMLYNTGIIQPDVCVARTRGWQSLYRLFKPDVVLFDHAPIALIASSAFDFKRVLLSNGFACPPPVDHFPDWRLGDRGTPDTELIKNEAAVLSTINEYLETQGSKAHERLSDIFDDVDLTLLRTLPELDHYGPREGVTYCGSWISGDSGSTPAWPNGRGKKLFAYLKPYQELPFLLNLLAHLKVPTLAYVAACSPKLLAVQCPTLKIVDEPVAINYAASACDAAILHAGSSSLHLLLRAKPVFQIPLTLEQRIAATRVVECGAGVCVNPFDRKQLSHALEEFLRSATYHEAARAFAHRYQDFDPQTQLDKVVTAIDELARS